MSQQLAIAKCKEVFAKALELYPHLNFDKVDIRFDLRGRAAGMACARLGRNGRTYHIRLNTDMLNREAADHVINETVPHEVAHIICFMDPRMGRNHDSGWRHVFMQLGGAGSRVHHEAVVYGKGSTYEYTTTTGHTIRCSEQRHKKIQQGAIISWRGGKGQTNKSCAYSIVGHQGVTLKTPIVRAGSTTVPSINPKVTTSVDFEARLQRFLAVPPAATVTLAPGKNVGTDQIPAGFGKDAVITMPTHMQVPVKATVTQQVARIAVAGPVAGESKAATSRRIMLAGHQAGASYETVIAQMMTACGYNRQLARGTYKANAPKLGIPVQ
jgi:SprT protein